MSEVAQAEVQVSEKKLLPAFLLCFFLGSLGIHRFYVGKIGTGILWLITLGLSESMLGRSDHDADG